MSTYIIGMGMGGSTLTADAKDAIKNADILIGAQRMLDMADGKEKIGEYSAERIADIINSTDKICAVLMSGDTGFFSGAERLRKLIPDAVVIPGISSLSYLSAKTGIPWQDAKVITLHGRDGAPALAAATHRNVFLLLGGENSAERVCSRFYGYGLENIGVYIGERLGQPDERITYGTARELSGMTFDGLSCLMTVNPEYISAVRYGIPDSEFERSAVPMTKSEIRAVIMSRLCIRSTDICWDIGCGSGSVSVEMALAAHDGKVFCIDRSEDAVRLTGTNLRRFSCDNAEVIHGTAPGILSTLPAPDCVFIGGTSGNLSETLDAVRSVSPKAKTVITAVTLETISELSRLGGFEITQVSCARSARLGSHTLMKAENPVYIAVSV